MEHRITAGERQREFSSDFQVLNERLYCIYCNKEINFIDKTTVERHIAGAKHKKMKIENPKNFYYLS
jgi:uncharacterized protein with PIN domain